MSQGIGEPARALEFNAGGEPFSLVVSGAALAFFAIIGFEDSVNMVEETTNPQRDFPRAFFIGITITGIVYMLVAFFTTALVPIDVLRDTDQDLLEVVRVGAPWFPLVVFSVIAMVGRRQHVADQPHDGVAACCTAWRTSGRSRAMFGTVHERRRTPWVAIIMHDGGRAGARELERRAHARRHDGAAAALRFRDRERWPCCCCASSTVEHAHYRAPTLCPVLGLVSCVYLASPLRRPRDARSTSSPACCCCIGIALFVINALLERRVGERRAAE